MNFLKYELFSLETPSTKTNSQLGDPGEPDYYFFLNDSLPEDRAIRSHLHHERLSLVVQYQDEDRKAEFDQMCLFCSARFTGGREACVAFFRHMNDTHQFNIGHPDNMGTVFYFRNFKTFDRNLKIWVDLIF